MSLQEKIDYSLKLLDKGAKLATALNPHDGYFVGFSGGKDSQVLLDLVKRAGVPYHAYFSVTGVDAPDTMYFVRDHYPDVTLLHHPQNYFALVEKYGLPSMHKRFCCRILKEGFGAGSVVLTGVRAEESEKRAAYKEVAVHSRRKEHADRTKERSLESIIESEHKCIKGKDKVMVYPLLHWTETDVWQYIATRGLPVNPCYQKFGRVGCMFCPYSNESNIMQYELMYPLYLKRLMKSFKIYWDKCEEHQLESIEEYYRWWKTKRSLDYYLSHRVTTPVSDMLLPPHSSKGVSTPVGGE